MQRSALFVLVTLASCAPPPAPAAPSSSPPPPAASPGVLYRGGPDESWVLDPAVSMESIDKAALDRAAADDPDPGEPPAPAAARERVVAGAPTWCGGYRGQVRDPATREFANAARVDLGSGDRRELIVALQQVGWLACDRRGYPKRQQRVAAWLQRIVNATGATVDELHEVMAALVGQPPVREATCGTSPASRELLCPTTKPTLAMIDVAELAGAATPLGTLAYLRTCNAAVCAIDLDRLDWAAAARQHREAEPDPVARFAGSRVLVELRGQLERRAAGWQAADRAAALAAYQAWDRGLDAGARAVVTDAARVLLGERAACAPLDTALRAAIAAAAPATLDAAETLWKNPALNVAWHARRMCVGFEANAIVAMLRPIGWLGPRALADRANHPYPGYRPIQSGPVAEPADTATEVLRLAIDKAEGTLVRFQPTSWSEANYHCVETRRVDRITDDGKIKYRENCTQTGSTAMKEDFEPATVVSDHAPFARGQVLVYLTDRRSQRQEAKAGAKGPTWSPAGSHSEPLRAFVLQQYGGVNGPLLAYWGVPLVR